MFNSSCVSFFEIQQSLMSSTSRPNQFMLMAVAQYFAKGANRATGLFACLLCPLIMTVPLPAVALIPPLND